jgi:hypothetical protein
MDVQKRPVGRPRLNPYDDEPSQRVGFVADAELRERLQAAGVRANRSLSAETRARVDMSFATQDMVVEALQLAYGGDNAALITLFAEVLRAVSPRAVWIENSPAGAQARRVVIRSLDRTMARLAHPSDPGLYRSLSVEGEVDQLLHDLGRTDASGDTSQMTWIPGVHQLDQLTTHVLRWGKEVRDRVGPLGERLVEINKTREAREIEGWSPAVVHGADSLNLLQAALEQVQALLASARLEAEAIEAQGGEPPMNKLNRLQAVETALTNLMMADEIAHEVDSRLNAPKLLERFNATQEMAYHLDAMMRLVEQHQFGVAQEGGVQAGVAQEGGTQAGLAQVGAAQVGLEQKGEAQIGTAEEGSGATSGDRERGPSMGGGRPSDSETCLRFATVSF